MNLLIVEDERMIARGLKRMLSEILADKASNITHVVGLEDAREFIAIHSIDLLLLDLNLSGDDGFDLLSEVVAQPFQTIIVSANTDQALRSYEYGVLDFVPKPVAVERLEQALGKVTVVDNETREGVSGKGQADLLSIRTTGKTKILKVDDVRYISAAGKYSEIYVEGNVSSLHEKNLLALLKILPSKFHRIHKSTIVNLEQVSQLVSHEGSKYELCLESGETLRVGRKYIPSLRDRLG